MTTMTHIVNTTKTLSWFYATTLYSARVAFKDITVESFNSYDLIMVSFLLIKK